jgi:urea transport system ATP-binding protein
VRFGGAELLGRPVHRIARAGIGGTFQTATVFEELTVLRNPDIAAGADRGVWTMLRRRGVPEPVARALETVGPADLADSPAGTLAHGQKQWLEIGMPLVQDVRLLLLDEPGGRRSPRHWTCSRRCAPCPAAARVCCRAVSGSDSPSPGPW